MKIAEAGHEIGHHGYAHERFAGQTIEQQIEIIEKSQRIFKELIGHEVAGFRTLRETGRRRRQNSYMKEAFVIPVPCGVTTDPIEPL